MHGLTLSLKGIEKLGSVGTAESKACSHLESRRMFPFTGTAGMTLARTRGQAVDRGSLLPAEFAGVLRLLVAFVEGVLPTTWAIGMPLAGTGG